MSAFVANAANTHRHELRFLATGALNTLFGLSFYPLLMIVSPWLARHYMVALLIAQVVCLVFAYSSYKLLVYRTKGRIVQEFAAFSSFYLGIYAINWLALPFLVEVMKLQPLIAQLGFALLTVIGSYFWHNNISFARRLPGGTG